jgi:hypothetical protein
MAIKALRALQQYILREVLKDAPKGVMQTLPNKDLIELNVQVLAQRLMQAGIDPTTLKNANQVENAVKMIESRPAVQEGITATKSAKIMDMQGKEIDPRSKIMGGKQAETDAQIKARLDKGNKEGIARIKNKKMVEDAIDNVSPGFVSGDRKYNAQIVAEDLAERKFGKEFYDLDQRQQMDLYDEALEGLSDQTRGMPDPEDFAQGGRAGFKDGLSPAMQKRMMELLMQGVPMDKVQKEAESQLRQEEFRSKAGPLLEAAKGGIARLGFKDGMTRRTFLKILGGAMAIPIVGKFLKPLKTAKGVTKVPMIKTDNVPGKPEWFDQLVNKVIVEGDDVTKRFATGERQSIHQKTLDDGSVVTVTEDIDDGVVRVEYESDKNVFEDPVQLQYKKPKPDEGDPRPTAEFTTAESGPVGRRYGPDDYEIEVDEVGGTSIRDLDSDVSKLKEYATGKKPTMTEIVQNKKRRDKAKAISEDAEAQSDAVIRRQGEAQDYDYEDFASGGIARMLGE